MTKEQIVEIFTSICKEVFENNDFEYSDDLTPGSVDGWTSLTNMMLVSEIEKEFGFKFNFMELEDLTNAANIVSAIQKHI